MDIASLSLLAANTLVAAAVTDAWESTRHKIARLFGRGQPDPAIERRLDDTRAQLIAASTADVEQVKTDVAAEWVVRLKDLLADEPAAQDELRALVAEIRALLSAGSVSATGQSIAAGRDINITVGRDSMAAEVSSQSPRGGSSVDQLTELPGGEARIVSPAADALVGHRTLVSGVAPSLQETEAYWLVIKGPSAWHTYYLNSRVNVNIPPNWRLPEVYIGEPTDRGTFTLLLVRTDGNCTGAFKARFAQNEWDLGSELPDGAQVLDEISVVRR